MAGTEIQLQKLERVTLIDSGIMKQLVYGESLDG